MILCVYSHTESKNKTHCKRRDSGKTDAIILKHKPKTLAILLGCFASTIIFFSGNANLV